MTSIITTQKPTTKSNSKYKISKYINKPSTSYDLNYKTKEESAIEDQSNCFPEWTQ